MCASHARTNPIGSRTSPPTHTHTFELPSPYVMCSKYVPIIVYMIISLTRLVCGRRRTIKCSSNQNVRSEHYDRLSYLPVQNMYLHTSLHTVCTDMIRHQRVSARMKDAIIVILCALYCNVLSPVNET